MSAMAELREIELAYEIAGYLEYHDESVASDMVIEYVKENHTDD